MTGAQDTAAAEAALDRLHKWGGPRLVRDMTAIFADEMPRRLSELGAALERNDRDAAMRATHSIKSSAGQLGAVGLVALAVRAEHLAESSQIESGPGLVPEMEEQLEQFLAWIRTDARLPVADQ